jgi:hypothetical protein
MILRDGAVFFSLEDAIDPDLNHPPGLVAPFAATLDQLLARRLMVVKGEDVTVRDTDQTTSLTSRGQFIALTLGSGKRSSSNQAARELFIGGLPAGIRQLQAVARVVLRGLRPLRDAVQLTARLRRHPDSREAYRATRDMRR